MTITTRPTWANYTMEDAIRDFKMTRTHIVKTIAPMMQPGGYAFNDPDSKMGWAFNQDYFDDWATFLTEVRPKMIKAGKWTKTRPHSINDFELWKRGDFNDVLEPVIEPASIGPTAKFGTPTIDGGQNG